MRAERREQDNITAEPEFLPLSLPEQQFPLI